MSQDEKHLDEMQTLSKQWRQKIEELEQQVDAVEGEARQTTSELLAQLKQHQAVLSQYINLLEREGRAAKRKSSSQLQNMLADIDDTYRRALAYFD
jgi:molecular chaperone GrpE (heat shock protein)